MLKSLLPSLLTAAALLAQTPQARIKIDTDRVIGEVHPHIFGNFAEHLGRCIYGGIYEPGSPLADQDGFRKDVMAATRETGVMGHKNAEDYAKFALEAAKAMRRADESIKPIPSGSSNFRAGYDWIGWNRTVLDKLKNDIDYVSLHN